MEFYPLRSEDSIEAHDLVLPRAKALLDALTRNRDFELVRLTRWETPDGPRECLVADITCDGVPKNNPHGLRYRERVAIVVSGNLRDLPAVYALRVGFPRLVHQQQAPSGSPAHLCLYFAPVRETLRTWTPHSFLRRIGWWIETSARGELHAADQPLDQLFFTSKYELVLPWNLEELAAAAEPMTIAKRERPCGGVTYFLLPQVGAQASKAILVEVTLPAIVHGAVEPDPVTLGQLADLLGMRGADLLPQLRPKLRELVDHNGAVVREDRPFTIILVHTPLLREPGGAVEMTMRRAFLLATDPLEVGCATGALVRLDQKFFSSEIEMVPTVPTEWRTLPLRPMEVLSVNTVTQARKQSGIADAGPTGVVVGAGALGSALLDQWGRSGWGQWTVIDNDHIRPHNLSRHTAVADEIGVPKVETVARLQRQASAGANIFAIHVGDASDPADAATQGILAAAPVVVDVSASLDYPRYASTVDQTGRHASVFITPSANAAVALVEDPARLQRLRTLEAQYYRAVIHDDWGREHLAENLGTFWSGASCRDISVALPYARVQAHAGNLAEQLPHLLSHAGASIRVWQRTGDRGAVEVHEIAVSPELGWTRGELNVYFDEAGVQQLRNMRQAALPHETGGVLLGYFDLSIKALILVAGLPAPPDSDSSTGSFERGVEGLKAAVDDASRRTAGIVGYVGEWHSHPRGHSANPSGHDLIQLAYLSFCMGDEGLPAVQLIIGEHDVQLLLGKAAS